MCTTIVWIHFNYLWLWRSSVYISDQTACYLLAQAWRGKLVRVEARCMCYQALSIYFEMPTVSEATSVLPTTETVLNEVIYCCWSRKFVCN